jgi:hypothetical protein
VENFSAKFLRRFHFNREAKILSSSELITVARVVQNIRQPRAMLKEIAAA